MWPEVIKDIVQRMVSDVQLTGLLGGPHIYRNRTRVKIQIPGVYWTVIYASAEENLAPVNVQLDVFSLKAEQSAAIETRIYKLLHTDTIIQYQNLLMYSEFLSRFDMHDENEGVTHSAMEFKFTPARLNG